MMRNSSRVFLVVIVSMALISGMLGCVGTQPQKTETVVQPPPPPPKPVTPPPEQQKVVQPPPPPPKKIEPPPPPPLPQFYEHVVRWNGETLAIISKWYTGKFSNWKDIVEANPGLNPKRIRKGNIIKIPNDLLITKKPLPEEFVQKFYKKKEEEPILFGPKK